MTDETLTYLRVGKIIKPHGIDGELVVDPRTDFPRERFSESSRLSIVETDSDELPSELTVENFRWHQERILLETREISDRNLAEKLRDVWLAVAVEDRVEDDEGLYGHQLIGLEVCTPSGESRGEVVDVHHDETNPLLAIDQSGEKLIIPLSPGLVEAVDQERDRIVMNFPDGWEKLRVDESEQV